MSTQKMSTVLDSIIVGVREDLAARVAEVSLERIIELSEQRSPALPAAQRLLDAEFSIISEVKRSSPSKGALAEIADPAALASAYETGGAAVISVLTEQRRFGGSLADLDSVRQAVSIPVLRKDFMVDEYQVHEARTHGADVILLIVAALPDSELHNLNQLALSLGMSVLVEVHDEAELERALQLSPALLGINARNLKTLDVDLAHCHRMLGQIPDGIVAIAESGISSGDDVRAMAESGARAALIGEALVKSGDPAETVREWTHIGAQVWANNPRNSQI